MTELLTLARLYVDIALWRRGPQDLPAVGILLPLTLCAYVLISVAVGEVLPAMRPGLVPEVLADTLFTSLWYWAVLTLMGRRERYVQTAAALFGLQCVLAAPTILSEWLPLRFAHGGVWLEFSYALALVMFVWAIVAVAQVLRAALARSLAFCLVLSFTQWLVELLVMLEVFTPAKH